MRLFIGLIALLLLTSYVSAATVHGVVYDFNLNKVDSVKVEINTTPLQRDITENGAYTFLVKPGTYMLRAEQLEDGTLLAIAEETVTVTGDGAFVVDIILFPELDEPVLLPEDLDLETDDLELNPLPWIALLSSVAIISALYYFYKRQKNGQETEVSDVLTFVKSQGGRTTQKDLRKAFPYSEAKMSLLLTDLEAQGKLKKIKKGRGNIIVLA